MKHYQSYVDNLANVLFSQLYLLSTRNESYQECESAIKGPFILSLFTKLLITRSVVISLQRLRLISSSSFFIIFSIFALPLFLRFFSTRVVICQVLFLLRVLSFHFLFTKLFHLLRSFGVTTDRQHGWSSNGAGPLSPVTKTLRPFSLLHHVINVIWCVQTYSIVYCWQ